MNELGLLLSGYDEETARSIGAAYSREFSRTVPLLGATGNDTTTVGEILEASAQDFGEAGTRVVMLLGFDEEQIGTAVSTFPTGIPRPIFCTLTEDNIGWTMGALVAHLREEQQYWREQARKQKDSQETERHDETEGVKK